MSGSAGAARSHYCGSHDEIALFPTEYRVMRNILVFAAILAGLGTFMAQIADKLTPAPASATAVVNKVADVEMGCVRRPGNIPPASPPPTAPSRRRARGLR
jgi:hypothetical protein